MLARRNVLILHAGALGDFVLSWPLLLALGRVHPQSRIIAVTHASKGHLAEAALRIESSDIEAGWSALHAEEIDPSTVAEPVKRMLSGAHSIYSFVSRPDDRASANLQALAGPEAGLACLSPRPPEEWQRHASDYLLEQLAGKPMIRAGVEQMLKSIALRGVAAARSGTAQVLVHPGSGSREKCWPVEKFVKLIHRLKRHRHPVRIIIGEVEEERFTPPGMESLAAAGEIVRPESYVRLLGEIRVAGLLIGNDSGPAHLSGIVGVPTLALFGPTDDRVWKPLGPRVRALRTEPLDKLGVDAVYDAAAKLLGEKT